MTVLTCLLRRISLLSTISTLTIATATFQTEGIMRAAQYEAGGPEKLYIGEVPIPELRDKEVLIKVYATAINRAETLQRQGKYPPVPGESAILGLEATGIIDKIGPGCNSGWNIGDRVMALLPGGGNAEYVAAYEDHIMPVPKDMPFTTAAAIPEVWLTAYQLLNFVGGVKANDSVLIYAGGSGVGTAAVQLTKLAGAVPYVIAGTKEKIDVAKSLGAVDGFNYKEEPFTDKVLTATGGKGVNMILDCVGASFFEETTTSLAVEGRWILYGTMGGGTINGDILIRMMRKRLRLEASTLKTRTKEYKTKLIADFREKVLPNFEPNGQLKTIIDTVLPLEQLSQAHALMESNKNTGKIVIKVKEEVDNKDEL